MNTKAARRTGDGGIRPRFTLAHGLAVSLLLHGALALPWLAAGRAAPAPPPAQLVVELFGMISNRQTQARQAVSEADRPAETPRDAVPPAPEEPIQQQVAAAKEETPEEDMAEKPEAEKEAPEKPPEYTAPSPVQVEKPKKVAKARPQAQARPARQAVAPAPPATHAQEASIQQTIQQARETEADAIRRYLSGVIKTIQGNVVYPPAALKAGYVGRPTIRFTITESGGIQPGSLAIDKSSGYPLLDDNALQAAQASAPFPRPPRQLQVKTRLFFREDG